MRGSAGDRARPLEGRGAFVGWARARGLSLVALGMGVSVRAQRSKSGRDAGVLGMMRRVCPEVLVCEMLGRLDSLAGRTMITRCLCSLRIYRAASMECFKPVMREI